MTSKASLTPIPDSSDFYSRLDVDNNATQEEIRIAYKKRALLYHPDKNAGSEVALKGFQNIGAAYEILSDPLARKTYDFTIPSPFSRTEPRPSTYHPFGFSSFSGSSSSSSNIPYDKSVFPSNATISNNQPEDPITRSFWFRDSSMKPGLFSTVFGYPYIDFHPYFDFPGKKIIRYTSGKDLGLAPEEPAVVKEYFATLKPFQSPSGRHNQFFLKTDENHEKYKQDKDYCIVHLKYNVNIGYIFSWEFTSHNSKCYQTTGTVEILMTKKNYEILEKLSKEDPKIKMETKGNITEVSVT